MTDEQTQDYGEGELAQGAEGTAFAAGPALLQDLDAAAVRADESSSNAGPDASWTDAAAELAAEYKIDLDDVTGTGQDGRITKDDVQKVVDERDAG